MTLYEIDTALQSLVDEETGELLDYEAFASLAMEREKKLENTALWVLDIRADEAEIKAEEDRLKAKREALEKKEKRLTEYLDRALEGSPFETSLVSCAYRKSKACVVDDGFVTWAAENGRYDLLNQKPPEPAKSKISAALKAGEDIQHAMIEERSTLKVK